MSLEIKPKESTRHAVRRIGRQGAEKARCALRECETMEAVHEVRKQIKQLRALLRLVQTALKRSHYRALTRKLQQAAQMLAGPRDAFVKKSAVAALKNHFRKALSPYSFHVISAKLNADCHERQKSLPRDLKACHRLFKGICRDFEALKVKGSGWKPLGKGLRRTYRSGRSTFRLARESGRTEDLHEWRKTAKDLLYQVRFLCRMWPEQMKAIETELDQLGEFLGDGHDLYLLTQPDTTKRFGKDAPEEIETMIALAGRRRKELQIRALELGKKFYTERASLFCKRLKQYWKHWRHESKGLSLQ